MAIGWGLGAVPEGGESCNPWTRHIAHLCGHHWPSARTT